VLRDGRVMAYGTMGGDGQPQTQAMMFARHVLFTASRSTAALDAPRWLLGRTWGSTVTNLRLESRFDGRLVDRLLSAGHDVEVLDEDIPTPWAMPARWCCIRRHAGRRARPARGRRAAGV
jgi:oxamate amidohydrolase